MSPRNQVAGRQVISCMWPLWCSNASVTPSASSKCQGCAEGSVVTPGLKQQLSQWKETSFTAEPHYEKPTARALPVQVLTFVFAGDSDKVI